MRVLMTCQPALSHATQFVPLARALERRGHSVVLATSAGLSRTLARHGLDVRTYGPDWALRPGDPVYDRTVGRQAFFGFPAIPDRAALGELLSVGAQCEPDLVLREYSEFSGWAVARALEVPLVTQGIMHRLPPPLEDGLVGLVGRIASVAGVAPPAQRDDLLGVAYLDPVPPSFRCEWEHGVPPAVPVAPSTFDGAEHDAPGSFVEDLGRTKPLVYVTLGTIFTEFPRVWDTLLTAVSELDIDVLVTTGSTEPHSFGRVPPNVHVESYVLQSYVLPRSRAIICHAGFNTLIGAFANGVPALCLPLAADQPLNASRCANSGAGINAANAPAVDVRGPFVDPDTLGVEDVRMGLRRLLDEPDFTEAARRLAAEIKALPAPADIATTLEHLAGSPPVTSPSTSADGTVGALRH